MNSFSSSAAMSMVMSQVQYPLRYGVADLRRVLKDNPTLTDNGFATHHDFDELTENRRRTFSNPLFVLEFDDCCRALAVAKRTKRPTTGSYGLKHAVERLVENYVSNGALICAAIALGFAIKRHAPNATIGVSLRAGWAWRERDQRWGWVARSDRPADWDFEYPASSTEADENE